MMTYVPRQMAITQTSFLARFAHLFRRQPEGDAWLSPSNAITRTIESGRDLASLEREHSFTPPPSRAERRRHASELMEQIGVILSEPVEVETPRIVITDDAVAAAPYVDDPAIEDGVLKPRGEKKTKKRWWRRAA